ncbi:MAG TPA: fluoride efflux transporter CrcB [Bacteroidia bacterium]|nr:fluoride efflux transporter CrcB [Bacteroidia bacterium]
MKNLAIVFVGGGTGSLARYGIALFIRKLSLDAFPVATLLSNVFSCLIVAVALYYLSDQMALQPALKLLLFTGFCGGFSTFSAFSYETVQLLKDKHLYLAVLNVILNISICFGLIFALIRNT